MQRLIAALCVNVLAAHLALAQQQAPSPPRPASSPASSPAAGDFLRRSRDILERAVSAVPDPDSTSERIKIDISAGIANKAPHSQAQVSIPIPDAARKIPALGDLLPVASVPNAMRPSSYEKTGAFIFVSNSMTDSELRAAFEVGVDTNTPVLFRGILKGATIPASFSRSYKIISEMRRVPSVTIDPGPFDDFAVDSVPSIAYYSGRDFVKLSGNLSLSHVKRLFEDGRYGDAGAMGPTREIAEPHFVQEMQRRVGAIDWEAKKAAALDRMWKKYRIQALPNAVVSSVRYFDPTVINDTEIRDPEGRLIAPAGSAVNPLDMVAFNKTIVVIDATDRRQLAFAKRIADEELSKSRGVIILTSAIDRDRAWDALNEQFEFLFPHRLFILDPLVSVRFGLQAVPSVLRAEGRQFRIDQVAINGEEVKQ